MAKKIRSINDLAEICGVSASTVSRVMNNEPGISSETRTAVMREAQKNDFSLRQRKRPAARKYTTILIVLPEKEETSMNPFFDMADLYEGINNSFPGEKKRLEVVTFSELRKNAGEYVDDVDGCMIAFGDIDDATRKAIEARKIPAIFLNRMPGNNSYVSCNNFRGMETIVTHIYKKGHTRVGYLGCSEKAVNGDRLRGFVSASYISSGTIPSELILNLPDPQKIGPDTLDFFLDNKCTAVACFSDIFAIRLIGECTEKGISIPKGLSVTGFDNSLLRQNFKPLLTTLNLSVYDMSFFAARWLRDAIINRQHRTIHLEIDGMIVEGDSVASV